MNPQGTDVTTATMPATIVNVTVEKGREGLFYATSPELKGLLVAEPTPEALDAAIPQAIRDLYEACGVQVMVTPARKQNEYSHPWVAMPLSLAKAALAEAQIQNGHD